MNAAEQPQDHPTLAKYPSHPTALYRGEDGVLWRVPLHRDRDEAVAVPVEDLVQARGMAAGRQPGGLPPGVCSGFPNAEGWGRAACCSWLGCRLGGLRAYCPACPVRLCRAG